MARAPGPWLDPERLDLLQLSRIVHPPDRPMGEHAPPLAHRGVEAVDLETDGLVGRDLADRAPFGRPEHDVPVEHPEVHGMGDQLPGGAKDDASEAPRGEVSCAVARPEL